MKTFSRLTATFTFGLTSLFVTNIIAAEKPEPAKLVAPKPEAAKPAPVGDAKAQAATPTPQVPVFNVTSPTHPVAAYYDFSKSDVPFAAYAMPGGVPSGARFSVADGVLTITNDYAGSFGVDTKLRPFDALQFGDLYFDYRIDPDVKVNIFLRVNGKYHGAIFSGPPTVRAGSVLLGKIDNVQADATWHSAHVPIRDWLRKLYPTADKLPVDEIIIGNWDNSNYLMAGFGGNGTGAWWQLDNFLLAGVGPGEVKFQINGADGKPTNAEGMQWTLDDGEATAVTANPLTATVGDGLHTLRLLDNKKQPVATYRVAVAASPPQIGAPLLKNNVLRVPIQATAGLDVKTIKLTVADRVFDVTSPQLHWDGAEGFLNLEAGDAGFGWPNGTAVPVRVEGVKDLLGRAVEAKSETVTVDFAKHVGAVPLPIVRLATSASVPNEAPLGSGTFEDSLDEWAPEGDGGAIVERDTSTAASGIASVRLTCPSNAAPFRAAIRRQPFDAGKHPILSFDYRVPPSVRVDFLLWFDGQPVSIQFTDRDNPWTRIGKIPNIIADDQWHHAEIDLGKLLRALKPAAANYRVEWLAIGDMGWLGNARGVSYWFDNFKLISIERGAPLQAQIELPDVTGLKAVSWAVDEQPETLPSQITPVTAGGANTFNRAVVEGAAAGRRWLHVKAQNGAGNWSVPRHVPMWLDGAPPQVSAPSIPNDAHVAPASMEFRLTDDTALNPGTITLTVQGKEYKVDQPGLTYNTASGELIWNVLTALRASAFPALANGARVEWTLKPVSDYATNATPEQRGSWIYDYAQDKAGPVVDINPTSHPAIAYDAFEGATPPWSPLGGVKVERVEVEGEPENHALRVTSAAENGEFAVSARPQGFDAAKASIIGFRYRIPENINLAMRIKLGDGRIWHIRLRGEANDSLGAVPDIVADNKWHWAFFDIMPFLKRDPKLNPSDIKSLDFVDPMKKTPANVSWEIDDFVISQAAPGPVKLSWQGHDLGGVAKYRVAWDQSPNTMPTAETTETSRTVEAAAGYWYAHIQAQDPAGNWGAVRHYLVLVQ